MSRQRSRRWLRFAALLGVLALMVAACGKSKSPAASSSSGPKTLVPVPGFDGTTIKLGVVTPVTGSVKVIGDPLTAGNKLFFDALNAKGGIGGKYKVDLTIVDSKYEQQTGVQQYNAIKDQVVMFAQLLGTPIVKGVLSSLQADKVVAAPATLDADWVHQQNLIPIGAPYQIQAINSLSWYLTDGGGQGKKICFAGHDDAYGDAGLAGYKFAAQELKFTSGTEARFKATDTDFTAPVQQLQAAGCEAVFLTATPTTAGGIMGKAATNGYAPKWIGQSPSYIGLFLKSPLLPYLKANYLVASEGTTWGDTSVLGMKEMIDAQMQYAPSQAPDPYFVFGYGEAWSVAQVLEKAVQMGDLSRDGIIKAVNSVGTLKFDGLFGDYAYGASPADRNPPRVSTVFSVDDAVPGGLKVVKKGIESDAAKKYTIPG